jgi:hypothetical protein
MACTQHSWSYVGQVKIGKKIYNRHRCDYCSATKDTYVQDA